MMLAWNKNILDPFRRFLFTDLDFCAFPVDKCNATVKTISSKMEAISHFLNFPYFQFSSYFPDIYFLFSWYFPISYFPKFQFFWYFPIFFFQVSILLIFPISPFRSTLSHVKIHPPISFLLSFHTLYHLALKLSQIPPHFHRTLQFSQIFPTEQVLFYPNLVPSTSPPSYTHFIFSLEIFSLQCLVRGPIRSLSPIFPVPYFCLFHLFPSFSFPLLLPVQKFALYDFPSVVL